MMKQKNVIFSGLLSYCHYMIMLGIDLLIQGSRLSMYEQLLADSVRYIIYTNSTRKILQEPYQIRAITIRNLIEYLDP